MEVEIVRRILEKNENAAKENRELFRTRDITCINLLGGAGSGKTTVLERLIPLFRESVRVAVLEGDLATTRDAQRIAALNVPVVQLLTEGGCHLTADLVQRGASRLPLEETDLLLIENVGNPICPANFDLGEHHRISVLSVPEGDDKPLKYPLLFRDADLVLITKCDLLAHTDFSLREAQSALRRLRPDRPILRLGLAGRDQLPDLAEWVMARCLATV